MLTEITLFILFLLRWRRKRLKGGGGGGEMGRRGTETEKEMKGKRPRSSSVDSRFLSFFLAPKAIRQLSPLKHSGAGLILPGAGHSCSSQGETGCCLA